MQRRRVYKFKERKKERRIRAQREEKSVRSEERERVVRESGRAGGVLIRWKRWCFCVGGCTKRRSIEATEGRRSLHLTLKRCFRALYPVLLSLSPLSAFSISLSFPPFPLRFASGTSSIFSSWSSSSSSSSSCLPASLTPRSQNGRCTRSYLPAASLVHLSLHESPLFFLPFSSLCRYF